MVIFGIAFISYLFPRFFVEKEQLTLDDKIDIIEITDIPITIQEKIILPPTQPNIPVPDDEIELIDSPITIKEYGPFDFEKKWNRPQISSNNKGFRFIHILKNQNPLVVTKH